jgi:DNA-directed RNA polymerase subunit RPC12/RpoP
MARLILNRAWQKDMSDKIKTGKFTELISGFNLAIQFTIMELLRKRTPYTVKNCGAGIKKITVALDECPMCGHKIITNPIQPGPKPITEPTAEGETSDDQTT